MAGALLSLSLFLITVCGLLLFKPPIPSNTITDYKTITTDYTNQSAVEARQDVAVKMAHFLEKNPEIVKQQTLTSLPLSPTEDTPVAPPTGIRREHHLNFQGSTLQFESLNEFDHWVFEQAKKAPLEFIKHLNSNDDSEQYLNTLKKVSEINASPEVVEAEKSAYLDEARKMAMNQDGYHQQMTAKALQLYLDLEKDLDLGKKTADEILNANNKQR